MTIFHYTFIDKTALADEIYEIAHKVVTKYASRAIIPRREKEDVIMAIVAKFLEKSDKILLSFEGKAKRTTYFTAIVNRMCLEVIRKESKHWFSIADEYGLEELKNGLSPDESIHKSLIKDELTRFNNIMLFFNGSYAKVILFLKFYFNIPVTENDIMKYSTLSYSEIKSLFLAEDAMAKSEKFDRLATVVKIVEGKAVKGDAVRMWLHKQMDIILDRLNGNGASFHSKDSLATLLEYKTHYYEKAVNALLMIVVAINY